MSRLRTIGKGLLFLSGGMLLVGWPWLLILWKTHSRIYRSAADSPPAPVAIVFGAGIYRDGTATPVLADRVAAAVDLYRAGKVRKIILTGDNRFPEYNEPAAMMDLALSLGVPEDDLVPDYAGRRTYDSCYRARFVFDVRQAILVSQAFHLPRAVYLCDQMGIEAVGVSADRREYRISSRILWTLREWPACISAIVETQITHPQPVLGPLTPIE
ncbi:MAG: vancomycin high temperature exclusion protein [Anaerolineales bacterium]